MVYKSNSKFHDLVFNILVSYKELGVSEIAKKIGYPVANVHRFLKNQEHFVQGENKKWRIPGKYDDWPLAEGEEEPEEEIKEYIADPEGNISEILEAIKHYREIRDLAEGRMIYLHRLGRRALEP